VDLDHLHVLFKINFSTVRFKCVLQEINIIRLNEIIIVNIIILLFVGCRVFFPRGWDGRSESLATCLNLALGLRVCGAVPPLSQGVFSGCRALFPWGQSGRGAKLTTHLHLVPKSKNAWSSASTPPVRLHDVVVS